MATPTTTAHAIRDKWITLIEALTPKRMIGTKFKIYTGAKDFREWVESSKKQTRAFHVKQTGDQNSDNASDGVTQAYTLGGAVLTIAYPHAWGEYKRQGYRRDYLDLEATAIEDGNQIRDTIGVDGGANYAFGQSRCDADVQFDLEDEEGVSYLVINLSYRFNRAIGGEITHEFDPLEFSGAFA